MKFFNLKSFFSFKVAEILLENGALTNAVSANHETPLHSAAQAGFYSAHDYKSSELFSFSYLC